ncbi:MAG: hypothetical protein KDA75_05405 [Planctomycetaceae bacterium]|nr:hypothetical protein [Planctomycetaceae bacterium]
MRSILLTLSLLLAAASVCRSEEANRREGAGETIVRLRQAAASLERLGFALESQELLELAERVESAVETQLADKQQRVDELERELQKLRQEISALGGSHGATVMVAVEIFEVNPAFAMDLPGGSGTERIRPVGDAGLSLKAPSVGVGPKETVRKELDRLIAAGHAKRVANPNLVTKEGQSAEMHSGGEFPVLVPQGGDQKRIEFRQFGLQLEAVPRRISKSRWSLDLQLENSERDFANQVNVGGVHVPGLKTVNASFRCELDDREVIITRMPACPDRVDEGKPVKNPMQLVVMASVEEIVAAGQTVQPLPTY